MTRLFMNQGSTPSLIPDPCDVASQRYGYDPAAFRLDTRLARVRARARKNISASMTLADAASVAGFERSYFSAFFRRKVGITWSKWLQMERCLAAMKLLRTTDEQILQIAIQVGYQSPRSLQKIFRRFLGMTPSEFRALTRRPAPAPEG